MSRQSNPHPKPNTATEQKLKTSGVDAVADRRHHERSIPTTEGWRCRSVGVSVTIVEVSAACSGVSSVRVVEGVVSV